MLICLLPKLYLSTIIQILRGRIKIYFYTFITPNRRPQWALPPPTSVGGVVRLGGGVINSRPPRQPPRRPPGLLILEYVEGSATELLTARETEGGGVSPPGVFAVETFYITHEIMQTGLHKTSSEHKSELYKLISRINN
jgi:hypothetical protein